MGKKRTLAATPDEVRMGGSPTSPGEIRRFSWHPGPTQDALVLNTQLGIGIQARVSRSPAFSSHRPKPFSLAWEEANSQDRGRVD